ncbi:class I SAM-dependent methyltransferase [Candidatus Marinarcus aquaticus]|uniref:Methyltransferase n=1 Tax=Candidatus Marinarcus aquaticus TaxID=2044504 RepID=A0A4Q0XPZ9_9BACT|nr:class I SAM-dependent methyltransferase [Candidatus Marinarcus aquaticus]RXJ57648.1 methyltransferase [Candidatus Marinarcus aquaticus]
MNIDRYLNMLLEGQKTEVLGVALNLKIFKSLEEENHTFNSLAVKLELNPHNTKVLLDALVLLDLLYKQGEFYKNEALTKEFFIEETKGYCGDVFLHRKEMLNHGKKMLDTLVKEGCGALKDSKHPKKWAGAAKRFLRQEQENLISKVALDTVTRLKEFSSAKKMLDLGCSSGIVGLEIIKSHLSLQGVLYDYKEVTDVVDEHIKEYGLQNRVTTLSGDIQNDDIGSGYDLIWCSNIFYFFKDKKEVIEKIYKALNTNGVLVSVHVEIDETDKTNLDEYFYFLFLNMQERGVLKPFELSDIFEETGFRSINSYTSVEMPMTKSQIHIAKK